MTTERLFEPVPGALASPGVLARLITAYYAPDKPVDRRQVAAWAGRGTVNQAGVKFPGPEQVNEQAKRGQPHKLYSVARVLDWYGAGVPCRGSNQWQPKWKDTE